MVHFCTVQTWLQVRESAEECPEDSARPTSRQVLRPLKGWCGTEVTGLLWGLGDGSGMLQEARPQRVEEAWDICQDQCSHPKCPFGL